MRRLVLVAVVLVPGCLGSQGAVDAGGATWSPLACDPDRVQRIGGDATPLDWWSASPEERARGLAEALGDPVPDSTSASPEAHGVLRFDTGRGSIHIRQASYGTWTTYEGYGRTWPGRNAWEAAPGLDRVSEELGLGGLDVERSVQERPGGLDFSLRQRVDGRFLQDATASGGWDAQSARLDLRRFVHDGRRPFGVNESGAVELGRKYFECQLGTNQPLVHVPPVLLDVAHDSFVHVVSFGAGHPNCGGAPIALVDARTGAIHGTAQCYPEFERPSPSATPT